MGGFLWFGDLSVGFRVGFSNVFRISEILFLTLWAWFFLMCWKRFVSFWRSRRRVWYGIGGVGKWLFFLRFFFIRGEVCVLSLGREICLYVCFLGNVVSFFAFFF